MQWRCASILPGSLPLSRLRCRCSFGAALPSGVSTRTLQIHYPKLSLRSTRPRSARAGRRLRLRSVSPLIQTWKEGHLAEAATWKSGNVGTVTRLGGFPVPLIIVMSPVIWAFRRTDKRGEGKTRSSSMNSPPPSAAFCLAPNPLCIAR